MASSRVDFGDLRDEGDEHVKESDEDRAPEGELEQEPFEAGPDSGEAEGGAGENAGQCLLRVGGLLLVQAIRKGGAQGMPGSSRASSTSKTSRSQLSPRSHSGRSSGPRRRILKRRIRRTKGTKIELRTKKK